LNQIKNLETFLTIPPEQIYDYENSEIFFLLNSRNPEDRAKGRQLEYERFGRVSDLSQKIREFAKEFKEASEKTAKEFGENTSVRMFLK
jgi:hypothetical protein